MGFLIKLLIVSLAVSAMLYLAWRAAPVIRFTAKLLLIASLAAVAGLLVAAELGTSTEGQLGWGFFAFVCAALLAWPRRSNDGRPYGRGRTGHTSRTLGEGMSSVAPAKVAVAEKADGAVKPSRLEMMGFTKAGRAHRESAKLAVASAAAWAQLSEEAEFARNRISVARRSCERFVNGATSTPFDAASLAHLVVVQKRVPEMIRRRLDICSRSSPIERRHLLDDLIHQLELIAAEGERRSSDQDFIPLEELQTERAYLKAHFASSRQEPEPK